MQKLNFLHSEQGLSSIEVLVIAAAAMLGLAFLAAKGCTNTARVQIVNANTHSERFAKKLQALVQDNSAWQNTVNDSLNAVLSCLHDNTNCLDASGKTVSGPIRVRDPQNAIAYDAVSLPNAGFNLLGQTCSGYDSVQGSTLCPLQFTITAEAICPNIAPPCLKPDMTITGTLHYMPLHGKGLSPRSFDPAKYNFTLIRKFTTSPAP